MGMESTKPVILVAFKEGGENGGPFISHKRIIEGYNSDKYKLKPFFFPKSRVLLSVSGMKKLVSKIREEKPVAMHIVGLQLEGFVATVACMLAKVPIILAVHGSAVETCNIKPLNRFLMNLMETFCIKRANVVYGVSDYVTNWKICQKAKKLVGTIYNLPENFNNIQTESTIRSELGLLDEDVVVVSTGRIIKDKGFDIMLQVMEQYQNQKHIKFVIAGEGYYKSDIEKRAKELNMSDQIYMLGYRSDIDNILAGSDIFMICTKHETLCISLQEAGAHKLPLVATNVGGIPEIIDSECGFLVNNEDVNGFKKALDSLVIDSELRNQMGNNAREKILSKFSAESIFEKLDKMYCMFIPEEDS